MARARDDRSSIPARILRASRGRGAAAIQDRGLFEALPELWGAPWFRVTLLDAYFGFLTVFVWVAYRETSWLSRLGWLVAFLTLGSMAIAAYVLLQIAGLGRGEGLGALLTSKKRPEAGSSTAASPQ